MDVRGDEGELEGLSLSLSLFDCPLVAVYHSCCCVVPRGNTFYTPVPSCPGCLLSDR